MKGRKLTAVGERPRVEEEASVWRFLPELREEGGSRRKKEGKGATL